ncbi:prepilin peptidase [Candidatus Curtissbacteria bacterium]|nr:prepilin peptidase [Candidatus Curtissbacteria bacterium]
MVFYLITLFILGAAVGSFLNVVIDRTTQGGSVLGPWRSYCDHCRATLATVDLVPILSFVGLGGRCRYCHHKLSWQYPAVEMLTGILFSSTFYFLAARGSFSLLAVFYSLFVISTLIVVATVDLKFSLVPTTFVFAASLLVLFWNYFKLSSGEFVSGVVAAFILALFFGAIAVATRGRGMGSGDIPLVFLLGLFLGWPASVAAVFLAFLSGAIFAIFLIFLRKKKFGQTIPFAPFLIASSIAVLYWGGEIIGWYLGMI